MNCRGFVVVRGVSRDAERTEHRSLDIANQHTSGHGDDTRPYRGSGSDDEVGLLLRTGHQRPRAHSELERTGGLARCDVYPSVRCAVFAFSGYDVAACVQRNHGEGLEPVLSAKLTSSCDRGASAVQVPHDAPEPLQPSNMNFRNTELFYRMLEDTTGPGSESSRSRRPGGYGAFDSYLTVAP